MKTVIINGNQVDIHYVTGEVQDFNERVETHVHGSGGGGKVVNGHGYINRTVIKSTNTIHQDIFLMDDTGQLHPIQLQNWKVPFARGHKLTVAWVIKKGEGSGPYILLHNHSTQQNQWNDVPLARFCRLGLLKCLKWSAPIFGLGGLVIWGSGGLGLGLVVGAAFGAYFNATNINADHLKTFHGEIAAVAS